MVSKLEKDIDNKYEYIGKKDKPRTRATESRRALWLVGLCIGVMCILQATLNITLRLYYKSETKVMNTSNYNMTLDELQSSYTNLLLENRQLLLEKDKLQTTNANLESNYNNVVAERTELQNSFPDLVNNIRSGWKYFKSSLYYISTEKKSWIQSRLECIANGADLVIIKSKDEEDFFFEQLGNESQVWIGLTMKDTEWQWVDGTAFTDGYWGGPTNRTNAGKVSFLKNLLTESCGQKQLWVCKKNVFY